MELDACERERARITSSFRKVRKGIDANVENIERKGRSVMDVHEETKRGRKRARQREKTLNEYAVELLNRSNELRDENQRMRAQREAFELEYGAQKRTLELQIRDLEEFLRPMREKWEEKCRDKMDMERTVGILALSAQADSVDIAIDDLEYDDNIHYIEHYRRRIRAMKGEIAVVAKKNSILAAKINGHERRRAAIRRARNELEIRQHMKAIEISQVKSENDRTISKREREVLEASLVRPQIDKHDAKQKGTKALKCEKMSERINHVTKKLASLRAVIQKAILGMVSKERQLSTMTVKTMTLKRKTRELQDQMTDSKDGENIYTARISTMKDSYAKLHSELKEVKAELRKRHKETSNDSNQLDTEKKSKTLLSLLDKIMDAETESTKLQTRATRAKSPVTSSEIDTTDYKTATEHKISATRNKYTRIQNDLHTLREDINTQQALITSATNTRKDLDNRIMQAFDCQVDLVRQRNAAPEPPSSAYTSLQHKISKLSRALTTKRQSLANRQHRINDQKKLFQYQVNLSIELSERPSPLPQIAIDHLQQLLALLRTGRTLFSAKSPDLAEWSAAIDHLLETK